MDNVPRCENCKGFINPFFEFLPGRKTFKCNLCHQVQNTPKQYQDPYGDYSNTELCLGSYEFFASDTYTPRPPMEPSYCFLIDISHSSMANNIPFYAIAAIKEAIQSGRFNGRKAVSLKIILFDTQLHIVRFRNNRQIAMTTYSLQTDVKYIPSQVVS